jgi:hypothetical protein
MTVVTPAGNPGSAETRSSGVRAAQSWARRSVTGGRRRRNDNAPDHSTGDSRATEPADATKPAAGRAAGPEYAPAPRHAAALTGRTIIDADVPTASGDDAAGHTVSYGRLGPAEVEHTRASRRARAAASARSVGPRGWLTLVASVALILTVTAAAGAFRGGARSELADSHESTGWSNPDVGTLPPDVNTGAPETGIPSTDAGVPGDGSPPPTSDQPKTAPAPPVPTPPAGPATYSAVSGESCAQESDHGYFRKGFAADWRLSGNGGWANDGCHGAAVAVPMSGDAGKDDNDNVVVWWFVTGAVKQGTCGISTYVPDTGDPSDAAGKPAHYKVFATSDASGPAITEFNLDQTRNRGRFVGGPKVKLTGSGRLSVRLVTRGVDFGTGRDGAHLGVSALRVSCSAA